MATKNDKLKDFELSLNELEAIVTKMESGELSLDESLKTFEKGISIASSCQQALDQASQKIEILVKENSLDKTIPFENNE